MEDVQARGPRGLVLTLYQRQGPSVAVPLAHQGPGPIRSSPDLWSVADALLSRLDSTSVFYHHHPHPVPLGMLRSLFQPQGHLQPRTCLAGAHRKSSCYSLKPQETTDDVLC